MLEAVSAHAVIRYLERVLRLPVAEWVRGVPMLDERKQAEYCCGRAGLTSQAVRLAILAPAVERALSAGAIKAKVVTETAIYVVERGKVITVLTPEMAKNHRRWKAFKSRQMEEV